MKFKKILMCTLMASLLLTGCKDNSSDNSGGSGNSGGGNSAGNSSNDSKTEVTDLGITSSKPTEIAGFTGNLTDVEPKAGDLIAQIEIEGFGTIKAVLFPEAAPVGVENFQKLADADFFDGLTIHRVIENFMFQGGSTNGDGTGGDALVNDGSFGIETAQNARHFYGALCYANAGGQNSTQFYIVNDKTPQDLADFNIDGYVEIVEEGKGLIKKWSGTVYEDYYRTQTQYYQNTVDWVNGATDEIKERYKQKGGTPHLDGNYTVFGQVYEGFDVIGSISAAEVTYNDSGELSKPVQDIIIKHVTVSVFGE